MPYVFAFLVAANAVFMGYNLLQQEKDRSSSTLAPQPSALSPASPLELVRPDQPLSMDQVPN